MQLSGLSRHLIGVLESFGDADDASRHIPFDRSVAHRTVNNQSFLGELRALVPTRCPHILRALTWMFRKKSSIPAALLLLGLGLGVSACDGGPTPTSQASTSTHNTTSTVSGSNNSTSQKVLAILSSSAAQIQADQIRVPKSLANKAVAYDYLRAARQLEQVKWPANAQFDASNEIHILQKLADDSNQLTVPSEAASAQHSLNTDIRIETRTSSALRHDLGLPPANSTSP